MRRGLVLVVLLLSACNRAPATSPAAAPPPDVGVARVGDAAGQASITGVGTIALRREVSLGFTSAGRIARLMVNEGDAVRLGQLLAALDTTTVSADLSRASAERDRAAAEYRRSETLLRQGWITRPRLESAKASLVAAEAQVRATGFQRDNAAIRAPGPGRVLARLAEPGQVIAAGTPVLVVGEETSGFVLRLPLTDRAAAQLTLGAPARVTLAALGDLQLTGHVIEIAGRADKATGTFAVEIALPRDPRLRSGQIGGAEITVVARGAGEIRVPDGAVFAPRAGAGFVYVVDPATRRVHVRRITLAETGDDGIRVTAGLAPGEMIATSRIDRLKDGMLIAPIATAR